MNKISIFLLAFLGFSHFALAQAPVTAQATDPCTDPTTGILNVTTNHSISIGGSQINYKVTTGFFQTVVTPGDFVGVFPNASAASPVAKACLSYTYYQVQNSTGAIRPVTFAYNGGPGSASLWLQLGLGPRTVSLGPQGMNPPDEAQLQDNLDTVLPATDFVFVDPITTGYSHPLPGSTADQFIGAYNDAESIVTFIRDFRDQFQLQSQPTYIMGESYGGIRSSLVAQGLGLPGYIHLNGIVLMSPCLSTTSYSFSAQDNIIPYVNFFPTFATSAVYHHSAAAKYLTLGIEKTFALAQAFANNQLLTALDKGSLITNEEEAAVAQQMADFTGLSKDDILANNLRIKDTDFTTMAAGKSQILGTFDSRFIGNAPTAQGAPATEDPSDWVTGYPYVDGMNMYYQKELNFHLSSHYYDAGNPSSWSFDSDATEFVSTTNLDTAIVNDAKIQVFIASGYYDLACPIGSVDYEVDHVIEAKALNRVFRHRYESGHMIYMVPGALHQMSMDLKAFYASSSNVSHALGTTSSR